MASKQRTLLSLLRFSKLPNPSHKKQCRLSDHDVFDFDTHSLVIEVGENIREEGFCMRKRARGKLGWMLGV